MNFIKKHLEYLKDNPEGFWFKRKLYGWGWTPARKEGWLTLGVYLVGVLYFAFSVDENVPVDEMVRSAIVPIVALTILLILICYKTGEKPKWQWGNRED